MSDPASTPGDGRDERPPPSEEEERRLRAELARNHEEALEQNLRGLRGPGIAGAMASARLEDLDAEARSIRDRLGDPHPFPPRRAKSSIRGWLLLSAVVATFFGAVALVNLALL